MLTFEFWCISNMKKVLTALIFSLLCLSSHAQLSDYKITVLATNISNYGGFGEWSFGALYEGNKESILFDTGFDENTVLHNAQLLGKDLSKVEKVVLSHFHSDHTGGLIKLRKTFQSINAQAFSQVYVAKGFFSQRYMASAKPIENGKVGPGSFKEAQEFKSAAENLGIQFMVVNSPTQIAKNLFVTGPVPRRHEKYNGPKGLVIKSSEDSTWIPDIILDDQSVGMMTQNGWVMMSGCGHSGLMNTTDVLQGIANEPIYVAVGGFHLWQAQDSIVDETAQWLQDKGMKKFMGGHCTGIRAATRIAEIIGIERDNLSHTAIGSVLTKDLEIIRSSVE